MILKRVFPVFLLVGLLAGSVSGNGENLAEKPGKLLVAGGGVRSAKGEMWELMFRERLAERPIGIISTASADPLKTSVENAEELSRQYGEGRVVAIPLREGDRSAHDPEVVAMIRECGGFFFTGGLQSRTVRALFGEEGEETPALRAIRDMHGKGAVVGGTSAGAAIMSDPMISGGTSVKALLYGATPVGGKKSESGVLQSIGIGFHPEVLYCQHHIERGRFGRLLVALAGNEFPQRVGVGVAEDTFVLFDPEENVGRILGARGVLYVDAGEAVRDEKGGISGVRVHRLERGDSIDFGRGVVIPAEGREEIVLDSGGGVRLEVSDAWGKDAIWDLLAGLGGAGAGAFGLAEDENFDLIFETGEGTRVWRGGEEGGERWTVVDIRVSVVRR